MFTGFLCGDSCILWILECVLYVKIDVNMVHVFFIRFYQRRLKSMFLKKILVFAWFYCISPYIVH